MRLVSIHKHMLLLLLMAGAYTANAQVWSLQQCIDTATVYNKNLRIGRNNQILGEQKAKEAKANQNPRITANTDYKYFINLPYQLMPLSTFNPSAPEGQFKEAQFGVPHNINANLQLAMPLYNPQVYGSIKNTKLATELTELQYKKSEEQLYFEITTLYYNAQILLHQLNFLDSNLVNAARLLKTTILLKEQLLAKGTDVSKVKLQSSLLSTHKENIQSKYAQVLNALKLAMGIAIEREMRIEPNIIYKNDSNYGRFLSLDIRLVQAQKQLIVSEINTLSKSRYLPTINLVASYGTSGFGYDKKPNNFLKFYPIGFAGIQLSYPIFNGTITNIKIDQKRIEKQNNELQFDLLTDQNNTQVENAKLQKEIAIKSIEMISDQINLAQTIYDQTIFQQKQGVATLIDILTADNSLREAQQNYLAAIVDFLKADLDLKKLTGNISIH